MLIRVMRFRGRPPDAAAQAEFTEDGGTIGRSSECTLPLHDPERYISRIQVEINWSGSQFLMIDRGSARCVLHNGQPAGPDKALPLHDGDELQVGDYVLQVELTQPRASMPRSGALPDPFGDLVPRSIERSSVPADHPFAPPAGNPDALIPDDFDPFGKTGLAPGMPAPGRRPAPSQLPPEDSLDRLFGLDESTCDPENLGGPLGNPLSQPNTASATDPFDALQARPAAPHAAIPDHAPEIHTPFPLPQALHGARFQSWEAPDGTGRSMIVGKTTPGPTEMQRAANHSLPDVTLPAASVTSGDASSASAEQDSVDALLTALLAGAGLRELPKGLASDNQQQRPLDEDVMQRLGALVRLFAQGVIDLLATRTTLKKEMRSAMTVIAPTGNNPLKFSPDAGSALTLLLAAHTPRGFMAPEAAVQDAMNDLVAHQVAVIAGMRAALQGLLQRFQPATLEKRLAGRSMLDTMLPMNRKAKLWEQFENIYGEVSKEAEDDFDTLFSREFVRAYEAQIQALEERSPAKKR